MGWGPFNAEPAAGLVPPHLGMRQRYQRTTLSRPSREKGVTLAGVRHILSLFEVMKKHRVEPPSDLREIFDRYSQII